MFPSDIFMLLLIWENTNWKAAVGWLKNSIPLPLGKLHGSIKSHKS